MPQIYKADKHQKEKSTEEAPVLSKPKGPSRRKMNPFAAFSYYPNNVKFMNEDPKEHVVLFLRRHPITNIKWVLAASIMLLVPSFIAMFPFFSDLPLEMQLFSIVGWYMLTTAFVIEEFLSWFFQVNIVTDERIIDVDFVSLLYREMSDANIDQIQDVTVKMGGALRTFFNFGDVVIQTAAEIPMITFEAIPQPDRVARVLRDLRIEEEQEKLEGRIR